MSAIREHEIAETHRIFASEVRALADTKCRIGSRHGSGGLRIGRNASEILADTDILADTETLADAEILAGTRTSKRIKARFASARFGSVSASAVRWRRAASRRRGGVAARGFGPARMRCGKAGADRVYGRSKNGFAAVLRP